MGTDGRKRGTYSKTEGRRADILRAAIDSVAQHGYERASLRDIAARAGISHPGLLHHFPDKHELLREAMRQREANDLEIGLAAKRAGASIAAIVSESFARTIQDPGAARSWLALTVAASRPDHPAHEFIGARQSRARAAFTGEPTIAADGAEITPDTKALLLVALIDGLVLQGLFDPTLDVTGSLKRFFDLVAPSTTTAD